MSPKPLFRKILVANRGEIAVRVMRACRELGIPSVAVYSEVDRASAHVRKADEAYLLGPAPASESYLNIPKLLAVAKQAGCDAVHPGYGFLSENPKFARACAEAKLKFIGPTAEAMERMGSKTRARQAMEKAGVPFVPGSSRGLELAELKPLAREIGYPVMLKAAAGGGGKGMRRVEKESELKAAFETARSEAQRAFSDGELYLEKYIARPRHIEVQVLADEHGHCIALGERECSIQRRHQKVVEEAPSPAVDPEMRRRMGEVAVRVAQAAGYTNAGTVEFLVDEKKDFYFLEMNTRLQVEHPVTEAVTGLDLVHLQIRIAAGEKLPLGQQDVELRGHAIECRVYAEDPDNNFFPSPGRITRLMQPNGPGIRRDSGVYEGWVVPNDYDPLLAKLIVHAADRPQAIARLERALGEYFVGGIKTNLSLFRRIVRDPEFRAGRLDTGFLDGMLARGTAGAPKHDAEIAALAAAIFAALEPNGTSASQTSNTGLSAATNESGSANGAGKSSWARAARREALR